MICIETELHLSFVAAILLAWRGCEDNLVHGIVVTGVSMIDVQLFHYNGLHFSAFN